MFYLLVGTAILVYEIVVLRALGFAELGAVLFCYGMTAASVADREGAKGPIEFIQAVAQAIGNARGKGPPE